MAIPKYIMQMSDDELAHSIIKLPPCPKCGAHCTATITKVCDNWLPDDFPRPTRLVFQCNCTTYSKYFLEVRPSKEIYAAAREIYYKWTRHLRRFEKKYGRST